LFLSEVDKSIVELDALFLALEYLSAKKRKIILFVAAEISPGFQLMSVPCHQIHYRVLNIFWIVGKGIDRIRSVSLVVLLQDVLD